MLRLWTSWVLNFTSSRPLWHDLSVILDLECGCKRHCSLLKWNNMAFVFSLTSVVRYCSFSDSSGILPKVSLQYMTIGVEDLSFRRMFCSSTCMSWTLRSIKKAPKINILIMFYRQESIYWPLGLLFGSWGIRFLPLRVSGYLHRIPEIAAQPL